MGEASKLYRRQVKRARCRKGYRILLANPLFAGARCLLILMLAVGTAFSGGRARAQDSSGALIHVVAWGETLYSIAQRYGVSLDSIVAANGLNDADYIAAGQTLIIPSPQTAGQPAGNAIHVVQAGETLYAISRRYGVAVEALVVANNLINPAAIFVGQRVVIPGAATATTQGYTPEEAVSTYVVQPGDTLTSIAARYGTSAWVLTQINNISNPSLLYVGQTLTIPSTAALNVSEAVPASDKLIVVDVSEQRVYVYEHGQLLWIFIASTGMPGSDTFRGDFRIQNKIPNAYASTWDLQMPYWLGFYWAGPLQNGFHALPILSNGTRLWEGLLGRPVSYGCVILSDHDAQLLYNWAEIGTPVRVQD